MVRSENEEDETIKMIVKIFEDYIIKYPDQWYNFAAI